MGLDQYVYRLKQVGDKTIKVLQGKMTNDLDWKKYLVLDKQGVDQKPEMYKDIMHLLRPIKLKELLVNLDQLKKDAGVPDDWDITCRSIMGTETTYTWGTIDNHISATVNDDNSDKYVYEKEVESYICYCKEVYYMRKHYDVQDDMYNLYDGAIENCGYYHMSEEMIDMLNFKEGKKVLDTQANNLYYHEWY